MKISEHIYFYPAPESKSLIKSSNTIVIVGGGNQIIIDPGVDLKKKWKKLLGNMRKNGLDIKNTTEIWLTHHHPDHTQLVRKIVKLSGAKVYCHPMAKKILEAKGSQLMFEPFQAKSGGKSKISGVDFYLKGFTLGQVKEIFNLIKIFGTRKVNIDKVFHDKDKATINSLNVHILGLPGHCPTELGFWIPKEKVLIIGDLIHPIENGQGGRSYFPVLNTFLSDFDQAKQSLEKMKTLNKWLLFLPKIIRPEILLPTHGEPVIGREEIHELFEAVLAKMEVYQKITTEFAQKYAGLESFKLISKIIGKLAEIFPEINQAPGLRHELRFAVLSILKKMEVGK